MPKAGSLLLWLAGFEVVDDELCSGKLLYEAGSDFCRNLSQINTGYSCNKNKAQLASFHMWYMTTAEGKQFELQTIYMRIFVREIFFETATP